MGFTGITATEAEINQKAGANASASFTDTMKTQSLLMAEGFVNSASRYNWCDEYASLNTDVKHLITEATASLVAIDMINYDMSGFTSRQEALTMINVLWARVQEVLKLLRDRKHTDYVTGA